MRNIVAVLCNRVHRYRQMATKVDESMRFMKAIGVDTTDSKFKQTQFYTAHECLLLPYEQALTRCAYLLLYYYCITAFSNSTNLLSWVS
jgi:3-deoxy-D-arabino-heptulosonate 7-phosphate (DAHP) synthase class II